MSSNKANLLEQLLLDKDPRTTKSLMKLNKFLEEYYASDATDYRISCIGRLSKASGGIGEVSIRNQSGKHYQELIKYWEEKAKEKEQKKPLNEFKDLKSSEIDLIKEHVSNEAARSYIFAIIAERNRLRNEIRTHEKVLMNDYVISLSNDENLKVNNDKKLLTNIELQALKDIFENTNHIRRYWTINENGSVKDEDGEQIFKVGFIDAIKKIIENES